MQASELSTAEIEAALERVLARPEFARPQSSPIIHWADQAIAWLGKQFGRFFDWLLPDLDMSAPGWPLFAEIALFLAAVAGALVLARLLIVALRAWRGRARARPLPREQAAAPATAEVWGSQARAAADRGDWRAAAAALYQAVVHRLAESGDVRLDSAKTPGDYRRELRRGRRRELAPALEAFVRTFEHIVYGPSAADQPTYARLRAAAADLGTHV